jgi:hypothetical protein
VCLIWLVERFGNDEELLFIVSIYPFGGTNTSCISFVVRTRNDINDKAKERDSRTSCDVCFLSFPFSLSLSLHGHVGLP